MRMKALKSFSPGGGMTVHAGQEFDVSDARAREYENRGMAIPVDAPRPLTAPAAREGNPAAEAGPLPSAGGRTGAARPLLSSELGQVQPRHRSTKLGAKRG